jgi:HlyD family secretion protein
MNTLERPSDNGATGARVETITIDPKRGPKFPKLPAFSKLVWRIIAAVLVVAIIATGVLIYRANSAGSIAYVTSPVVQQDLVQTVSATGTVNPQNTISVGTQVSGTISEVDVDFNSKVKKGQVLARLDPTALQAALDSAKAQLAQSQAQAAAAQNTATGASIGISTANAAAQAAAANARAALATAQSSTQAIASADSAVVKAQSALNVANLTVSRDNSLLSQGYIAQATVDLDKSNAVAAQSGVQTAQISAQQARSQAQASTAQAQASAAQNGSSNDAIQAANVQAAGSADTAQASSAAIGIQAANVQQAETNLQHSVITSPVDGTVIARDVSVGTTVAASLQTPTLFSIAQDLSKMEVDLAVGEPDIGSVKNGETVNFTVLAFPNRTFHGIVSQVRKNAVVTSNVVTYTTVVLVDNNDQALLPGMTANATIGVQTAANAFVVPLGALTYQPAFGGGAHRRGTGSTGTHTRTGANGAAPAASGATAAGGSSTAAAPWGTTTGSSSTPLVAGSTGRIFVQRAGKLVRVPVSIKLISGAQAAVAPAGDATLVAGDQVVTGDSATASATHTQRSTTSANPLAGGGAPGGGAMRGIH